MKKIIFICGLIILGITAILLTGGLSARKDEQKIIKYLNQEYGEDAYNIQENKEHGEWNIILEEYPDITFHCNVFHDYLALGSPIVQTDFRETFSKCAIDDFKSSTDLVSDDIIYLNRLIIYSTQARSMEEIRTSYDRLIKFADMVSEKYPILIRKNVFHVRMDIKGIRQKNKAAESAKVNYVCEVENGNLLIKPFDDIYYDLTDIFQNR